MKVEFENTRSQNLKGKITCKKLQHCTANTGLPRKVLSRNSWEERGPADFPQDLGCLPASKRSWKLRWERWAKLPCFSILLGSRVTHDYIPRKSLFQCKRVQWKQMPKSKKGISRCASTLHGTSVCRSTSNFQVIQKVKVVKLGNQHPVLFLFVSRYPRSMFSIPQCARRCV